MPLLLIESAVTVTPAGRAYVEALRNRKTLTCWGCGKADDRVETAKDGDTVGMHPECAEHECNSFPDDYDGEPLRWTDAEMAAIDAGTYH